MAQQHVLTSQPVNTCRPQARKRRQRRAEMERAAPARLMAQGAAIRTGSSARQCRSRLWRESPEARLELPATASVQTSRVKVCPSFRLEHACARPAYPRDPHALLIACSVRVRAVSALPRAFAGRIRSSSPGGALPTVAARASDARSRQPFGVCPCSWAVRMRACGAACDGVRDSLRFERIAEQ